MIVLFFFYMKAFQLGLKSVYAFDWYVWPGAFPGLVGSLFSTLLRFLTFALLVPPTAWQLAQVTMRECGTDWVFLGNSRPAHGSRSTSKNFILYTPGVRRSVQLESNVKGNVHLFGGSSTRNGHPKLKWPSCTP